MKSYIENNRLIVEADEGMWLTDGEELFVKKYDFAVGVETNDILHEITEEEYNRFQEKNLEEGGTLSELY